jgi:two-component system sensor histidine kinase DesK
MSFFRIHFHRVFVPSWEQGENPTDLMELSGISSWLWRLYGVFWIACFGYALFLVLQTHLTLPRVGIIVGSGIVCGALYLWFIWPHPIEGAIRWRTRFPVALGGFIILTLVILLLSSFDNPAWLWLLVCASAVAGLIFPPRIAGLILVVMTLGTVLLGVLWLGWIQAIPLALLVRGLGLDMIGFGVVMGGIRQLQQQRQALAQIAVTEERLRVARDLHDVIGRTLSAMTLKSALASRLVSTHPEQAIQEMKEVEQTSRNILREIRATLEDYRQLSLKREIEGACQLLESMQIRIEPEIPLDILPQEVDTALAWVIREGITNVLRHSRATWCQIRIQKGEGNVVLDLSNDGRISEPSSDRGQGIVGIRERVEQLAGHIDAGPIQAQGGAGFCLHVEIPIQEEKE